MERNTIQDLLDALQQQRDELAVRIHLGQMEAKEEWERLEKKWEHVYGQRKQFEKAAGESAENVAKSLKQTGEEIRKGYERIRELLKS